MMLFKQSRCLFGLSYRKSLFVVLFFIGAINLHAVEPQVGPDTKENTKNEPKNATEDASKSDVAGKIAALPFMPKISGYIQAQGYYEDLGTGNPKTSLGKAGLRIPRARLKASGELDQKILKYELQINANDTAVSLEDAFLEVHFLKQAFFTAGRFTMPFGDEIYLSSKYNSFVERSRFWNYILKESRNIGGMITIEPVDRWKTQLGYFSTFYDATTPRIQDVLLRTTWQWSVFSTGLSFYYDDKKADGSIYEVEKDADLFLKLRSAGFLAAIEIAAVFISPTAFEFTGIARTGLHAYLSYTMNPNWEVIAKYAYLGLDKSQKFTDDQIHDVIVGLNYHFSEYNKIQLNYNPSFHTHGKIANAIMIQVQGAF